MPDNEGWIFRNIKLFVGMHPFFQLKKLFEEEPKIGKFRNICEVLPITHNNEEIILQFLGWSINLKKNGEWYWEDTTGG